MMFAASADAQRGDEAAAAVKLPATTLPFSGYASPEAEAAMAADLRDPQVPPSMTDLPAVRRFWQAYSDRALAKMRRRFDVRTEHRTIGGVGVEVVTPASPDPRRTDRVLINLHGGAFMWGAGSGALVEAVPIAAVARTTVVTVDYRLAPEHRFPAAVEDAVAVYQALLRTYRPEKIGIYGCSAGGALTAEATAMIVQRKLPVPAAIGTLCGTGLPFGGDSAILGQLAMAQPPAPSGVTVDPIPYFSGVTSNNPVAYPGNSKTMLAAFPPTLLLGGSRDFALSAMATMSRRLEQAGVETHLQVFDGMGHAFFMNSDLPESLEAYQVISSFFDRQLSRSANASSRRAKR
ncbi:alpha/beta hydrolase [Sphingomonas sp. A2-49]|uniref:alpha/beta hydrolase n=1 Tax=Sphingomonas sp. A2-49 TaxID=1391375 RepID=UPI0021D353A7|nr:alpha/beta hydrolase [Sphingomonas sp. A2-49]MCU6455544.1 alpha/beta hydrolase [Sphingomonas sp. A2-49]